MISRTEFVKMCGLFGLSLPLQNVMSACNHENEPAITSGNFKGKVLIIGAGAAGMSSAYLLHQLGINYQILEADVSYGGRFKTNTTFTDFPIPLGAEWLHVSRKELTSIVNNSAVTITTKTKKYTTEDTMGHFSNGELTISKVGSAINKEQDQKFINSSWFDFFEEYIVPSIQDNMQFNTPIKTIDYTQNTVLATDTKGKKYEADKIIITVPIRLLQLEQLSFNPTLPNNKIKALSNTKIWSGMKVFLTFAETFYPTFLYFDDSETNEGQRMYYDAAYGQNSSDNILGLFAVGKQAEVYQNFKGKDLEHHILKELDTIFDGKASAAFEGLLAQNWNEQPYAQGAYLSDNAATSISRTLSKSIDNKVYFAGCSYTKHNDWSSVHTAAQSARDVIRELVEA